MVGIEVEELRRPTEDVVLKGVEGHLDYWCAICTNSMDWTFIDDA